MKRLLLIELAFHLVKDEEESPTSPETHRCHICGCPCREATPTFDQGCCP